MHSSISRLFALGAMSLALGAGLVACGSSSSSTSSSEASTSSVPAPKPVKNAPVDNANNATLGPILVDGSGLTLYLWEADTNGKSACTGDCATHWHPYLTAGAPKAGPGVQAKLLGTTTRSDGTTQVTYNNHPVYTYEDDHAPGDIEGQGSNEFGALWYAVSPAGDSVTSANGPSADAGAGTTPSSTTSSGSGYGY